MMTDKKINTLPPEALGNLQNLRAVRKALGLSQEKLAMRTGVSTSGIRDYESGRYIPSPENYSRLAEFFGWDKAAPPPPRKPPAPLKPSPAKPKLKPKPVTLPAKSERESVKVIFTPESTPRMPRINVSFTEGMCYEIHDSENVPDPMSLAIKQSRNSGGYIFMYEGRQGIHHVFREIRGKWIRTYTDAQLVGKYVKEAEI